MPEEKAALVLHPSDSEMFKEVLRELKPNKNYAPEMILKFFEWIDPVKLKDFNSISIDGKKNIKASAWLVPFSPEMTEHSMAMVKEKIEKALELAAEDGCTVAAMAGFTSIAIQGSEEELSEKYGIRITSGNTTTAAIIVQSIEEACRKQGMDLQNATVSIIGASGDIGFGCFLYFAEIVEKMILTARGLSGLDNKVEEVRSFFDCEIETTTDNDYAIKNSDIVIFVTSAFSTIYNLKDFESNTIVCDASAPQNVEIGDIKRDDVYLYHGGIAEIPISLDFGFPVGLASANHLHGCQVEGLINASDPKFPLSKGRGLITANKINKVKKLLGKPFNVSPVFTLGDRVIN